MANKKAAVVISHQTPSLAETCDQLEALYQTVLDGATPLDRARVALGVKKQQMRRFDWAIQIGRMQPNLRPMLAGLLGLSEPKQEGDTKALNNRAA